MRTFINIERPVAIAELLAQRPEQTVAPVELTPMRHNGGWLNNLRKWIALTRKKLSSGDSS